MGAASPTAPTLTRALQEKGQENNYQVYIVVDQSINTIRIMRRSKEGKSRVLLPPARMPNFSNFTSNIQKVSIGTIVSFKDLNLRLSILMADVNIVNRVS